MSDDEAVQNFCGIARTNFDLLYVNVKEDLREMLTAANDGSRRAQAVAEASDDWARLVQQAADTDKPMRCLICDKPYSGIVDVGGFIAAVDIDLNVLMSGCCTECDKRDWRTNSKLVVMKMQSQAGDTALLVGEDDNKTRQ
jgi:hypothetical protein